MSGQQDRWEQLNRWDPQDPRDAVTMDLSRLIERVQQEQLRAEGAGQANGNGGERSPRPVHYLETDAAVERDRAARTDLDRQGGSGQASVTAAEDRPAADEQQAQVSVRLAEPSPEVPHRLAGATEEPGRPLAAPADENHASLAVPREASRPSPGDQHAEPRQNGQPGEPRPNAEPRQNGQPAERGLRDGQSQEASREPAEQPTEPEQRQPSDPDATSADRGRDQPAASQQPGSLADLRQRLQNLPAGHPSSPYHDDGARKPPPPRLKHLELAPPGRDRPGEAARLASAAVADLSSAGPETSSPAAPSHPSSPATPSHDRAPGPPRHGTSREALNREPIPAVKTEPASIRGSGLAAPAVGPGIAADGSWRWGSASLSPDQVEIAQDMHDRLRAAEGRNLFGSYGSGSLTATLRRIEAQLEHGRLAPDTELHALIDPDMFRAELAGLIRQHPGALVEDLSRHVTGALSYAFLFDTADYSVGTWLVHDALRAQGFRLDARKNAWGNTEHKCVVSWWLEPSHDVLFQVQFHTTTSFAAQQLARTSATAIRDPRTPPGEAASLRSELASAWAAVTSPPGISQIGDYRRSGR